MADPIIDQDVIEAMLMYGGNFASRLAGAYQAADDSNRRRLREAFPDLWEKYGELVQLRRQRGASV